MNGTSSGIMAVKVDRCCNRHWRLLLFLTFLALAFIMTAMFISMKNEEQELLDTDWRNHWSEGQSAGVASKVKVEQAGYNAVETELNFEDYAEEENPIQGDAEYYDNDNPDSQKNRKNDPDYFRRAQYDDAAAKKEGMKAEMGVIPEIKDYTLQPSFKSMFRNGLPEPIKFDEDFRNPCWSETVPKFPYQSNSYLNVNQQARILEPQFQLMRKRFAARGSADTGRWRQRCLPYYYVMETPPQAVPSLYTVLGFHPSVVNPEFSEPEFWNQRGPDNVATLQDYVDLFDNAAEEIRVNTTNVDVGEGRTKRMHKMVTGDGTSSYLWTIDNWARLPGNEDQTEPKVTTADLIHGLTPKAKVVIVLRNPTERLFEGYLARTENPSAKDFHEKVGQAMEAMASCEEKRSIRSCLYDSQMNKRLPVRLRIGMYFPYVEDWMNVFGKDQVKVVRYEDYIQSTSQIINDVCAFLGLMPFPTTDLERAEERVKALDEKRRKARTVTMLSATRAMLKEFHRNLNEKLAQVLGDDRFTWPELIMDTSNVQDDSKDAAGGGSSSNNGGGSEAQQQQQEQQPVTVEPRPTLAERLALIRGRQQQALQQQQQLRASQIQRAIAAREQQLKAQAQQQQPGQAQQQQAQQQQQVQQQQAQQQQQQAEQQRQQQAQQQAQQEAQARAQAIAQAQAQAQRDQALRVQQSPQQANQPQPNQAQPQPNQPQPNQPQANQAQPNQAQPNQAQGNQAQGNQAQANQAQPNQAQGNQAQGNQAQGNQAQGNQAQPNQAQGNQALGNQVQVQPGQASGGGKRL